MKNTQKTLDRLNRLIPVIDGMRVPRYLRLYDCGDKAIDHYTAVFTGKYQLRGVPKYRGWRTFQCNYISFNEVPHSPNQGFWQHGSNSTMIDVPRYSHLGKRIQFKDLPEECRRLLMDEYKEIWGLSN
jgi:hypothetical protein